MSTSTYMGLQAGAVSNAPAQAPASRCFRYARATAVDSTFLFPPLVKRYSSTIQHWRQIIDCKSTRPLSISVVSWMLEMERPTKRARICDDVEDSETSTQAEGPRSLSRPISPPHKKNNGGQRIKSPFQLTWIRDLPEAANRDAVALKDILGDPLIAECWEFNYLHDIHFLMSHFDEDTKSLVKVHVVHGFWKREDPNRLALQVSP